MERFHPADDRLIALYFGDEGASAEDRRAVRQHLHGCEACTWRYTELTAPLERLRQDAASEADEVFTPARLDRQRAAIFARIDGAAAEPRVIPFPSATLRLDRSVMRRPMARWIAAAAAAGLLLGVAGGRMLDLAGTRFGAPAPAVRTARTALSSLPSVRSDGPVVVTPAVFEDESALIELDQAVHTQRIDALSALDELTPHMRPEAMIARARAIR